MNRIKQLRDEKGWNQVDLGKYLNVRGAAISKYETGKIPLTDETIKKLAQIFNVSADFLLGIDNKRGTNTLHSNSSQELDKNLPIFKDNSAKYELPTELLKRDSMKKLFEYLQDKDDEYIKLVMDIAFRIEEREKTKNTEDK